MPPSPTPAPIPSRLAPCPCCRSLSRRRLLKPAALSRACASSLPDPVSDQRLTLLLDEQNWAASINSIGTWRRNSRPMDDDRVFAEDAPLQLPYPKAAPPPYNGRHAGQPVAVAASGVAARKDSDYEDTPLLSRDIDDDCGARAPHREDGDDRGPPSWSGERDFEGRPWWNRPSV